MIGKLKYVVCLTCILLFLCSFLPYPSKNNLDINLEDSYFVIAHSHVIWFLVVVLLIILLLNNFTSRIIFSKKMMSLHIYMSLSAVILFALPFIIPLSDPWIMLIGIFAMLLFVSGQLFFVGNLLAGLFKRIRKSK